MKLHRAPPPKMPSATCKTNSDRASISRRRDRIHTGVLLHTVYDVIHTLRTVKSLIKRRGSDTN